MKNAQTKPVYSRLHALAQVRKENFQLTLNAYARERLLYRLGRSPYRRQFILKGATLFAVWAGTPYRSTMDVDFLGHRTPDPERLTIVFQALCEAKVRRDGVEFLPGSVRTGLIREDTKYGGYWVRLEARIGKARIPVKIEVGFGDAVVPKARETLFPTLLDMPKPRLRTYRRETMVAEKFQAMVRFEMDNTRMKDYYDLWMLSREFAFEGKLLSEAIRATFDRRKTPILADVPVGLAPAFCQGATGLARWENFVRKTTFSKSPLPFSEICGSLREFLLPVAGALAVGAPFKRHWEPGGPWQGKR